MTRRGDHNQKLVSDADSGDFIEKIEKLRVSGLPYLLPSLDTPYRITPHPSRITLRTLRSCGYSVLLCTHWCLCHAKPYNLNIVLY